MRVKPTFADCIGIQNFMIDSVSNMEEVLLRFPHIGEQIFEELGDQNLIQCLTVSRNWKNLLEDCKFLWIRMILGISNPVTRVNYYKSKRILKKSNSQDVKKMQIAALGTLTNGRSYLWVIQKFHIGDIIYFAIKSGLIEIFKETFKEIFNQIYTIGYNELRPFAHENLLNYAADQGNL